KQGASIRIALRSLLFQKVDEPHKRIKADDLEAVGHKVGERVDIVKIKFAVAIVDDVLNAADFNPRLLHDALDLLNDLVRRCVAFHLQAGLRGVHGARGAGQVLSAGGLADVGGAEIKSFAGEVDFNSV